jgi:hypothetical protein
MNCFVSHLSWHEWNGVKKMLSIDVLKTWGFQENFPRQEGRCPNETPRKNKEKQQEED